MRLYNLQNYSTFAVFLYFAIALHLFVLTFIYSVVPVANMNIIIRSLGAMLLLLTTAIQPAIIHASLKSKTINKSTIFFEVLYVDLITFHVGTTFVTD